MANATTPQAEQFSSWETDIHGTIADWIKEFMYDYKDQNVTKAEAKAYLVDFFSCSSNYKKIVPSTEHVECFLECNR